MIMKKESNFGFKGDPDRHNGNVSVSEKDVGIPICLKKGAKWSCGGERFVTERIPRA